LQTWAALAIVTLAGCYVSHERERFEPIDAGLDAPVSDDAATLDAARSCWALEIVFTPTARAQIAVWLEQPDAGSFRTLFLTEAVAYRGIGNRPGALQMNSGFRWPYGRREGVLPAWAHRRVGHGATAFPRVVFQARSEGYASRTGDDSSPEDYFCLSFDAAASGRDGLDALSCASPFHGDRGRYLTDADVAAGYAEPFEDAPAAGRMRPLADQSVYPPRRDVTACTAPSCHDHPDLDRFAADARAAMPEIDEVTAATPRADVPHTVRVTLAPEWPRGTTEVWLEIHTEGDYNEAFGLDEAPTPESPLEEWDYWARNYGYPYRGQPSVVFRVALDLRGSAPVVATAAIPEHHTTVHGLDGTLVPFAGSAITDDPSAAPGSGADRVRFAPDASRVRAAASRVACR
jgi:hypothetical protein